MKTKLILIGAGGHCRSCIEVIESTTAFEIKGLLDSKSRTGESVSGYKIIGDDSMIASLIKEGCSFLIAIGQVENAGKRKDIYNLLKQQNATMATVIAPRAYVSRKSSIGEGSVIMHNAFINAGCEIGVNAIINTGAIIEHDVAIGNHCHISTNAVINGGCKIESEVFIGSGATLINGIKIPSNTIIGAGTVLHKSVISAGTYTGEPFRKIK